MKELLIFAFIAVCSLVILGYTVHMFIGGIVSATIERWSITTAVVIGTIIVIALGLDIVKHRNKQKS